MAYRTQSSSPGLRWQRYVFQRVTFPFMWPTGTSGQFLVRAFRFPVGLFFLPHCPPDPVVKQWFKMTALCIPVSNFTLHMTHRNQWASSGSNLPFPSGSLFPSTWPTGHSGQALDRFGSFTCSRATVHSPTWPKAFRSECPIMSAFISLPTCGPNLCWFKITQTTLSVWGITEETNQWPHNTKDWLKATVMNVIGSMNDHHDVRTCNHNNQWLFWSWGPFQWIKFSAFY